MGLEWQPVILKYLWNAVGSDPCSAEISVLSSIGILVKFVVRLMRGLGIVSPSYVSFYNDYLT